MARPAGVEIIDMHRRIACLLALILLPAWGCSARRDSAASGTIAPPQTTSAPAEFRFADYLDHARYGLWVYERTELDRGEAHPPERYVRRIGAQRLREGELVRGQFGPIEQYLQTPDAQTPASPDPRLTARARKALVSFFTLDEALYLMPPDLEVEQPRSDSTTLTYFDENGRRKTSGTLTRTVTLEGFEPVTVPAGTFERCARVRVDLAMRFDWGPTIEWMSRIWLSPNAGEVQRFDRVSGALFIFFFSSSFESKLVSYEPLRATTRPGAPAPRWSRGLIILDRVIPHPRISGLLVDFPSTRPAIDAPIARSQ